MSVRKRDDRDGQYEVRWREGGRQRSRLFGKKGDALEDLKKARWYLDREIANLENAEPGV